MRKQNRFNGRNSKAKETQVRREQPRKDSKSKRINMDNEREDKLPKDMQKYFNRHDSNDIRWYSKTPARVTAAGRIPFASINGVTKVAYNDTSAVFTVPGVMALKYSNNFVVDAAVTQQAFQNLYSDIVHANSRNQSYDYTDLAIMLYAGCEVFAAIALGIRAYGVMRNYIEQDTYTPNAILHASGFNPDDLRINYSHMWDDLLQLIAQSRQIWIPNTMPIIERRLWMNLNVYRDSNTTRAQYYLYVPRAFYKYEGYTDRKGGRLILHKYMNDHSNPTQMMKWPDYIAMVQGMIDALIPDQDRGIMYGDILKAYGKEGIFAMNEIGIDYKTIPTYNPEVLTQFENATILPGTIPVALEQNNLKLEQHFGVTAGSTRAIAGTNLTADTAITLSPLLNFHQEEQPTPEQIMIATRMTAAGIKLVPQYSYDGTLVTPSAKVVVPSVAGTEYITQVDIFRYQYETGGNRKITYSTLSHDGSHSSNVGMSLSDMFSWVAFDWAPMIYHWTIPSSTPIADEMYVPVKAIYAEYDNYTFVDIRVLEKLHEVAYYSLYNVPTL